VPLMLKLPGGQAAGKRIDARVELADVLPTLLQATGISVPKEVQGQSLLPLMKPSPAAAAADKAGSGGYRAAYAESDYPHRTFGWSTIRAWRTGKYLFIEAPRRELYDQALDPKASHDLSAASTAVADTLDGQLQAFRQRTTSSKDAPTAAVDPGFQERLAALGYVASDSTSSPMPGIKETGSDPKDKIEVVNLLHHAEMAKEELHFEEAVPLLQQVIAKEPNLPIAYLQLGTALMSLQSYTKAVPILRRAVELRPDLTVPRYQLGSALFETDDFAGAAAEFEAALARVPDWAEARFSLATTYARMDRMQDAIREYQKVVELRPRHYGAYLLLGRALALSGNPEAAIPNLEKAAALQPKSAEPHAFLADAYDQLGKEQDAQRERSEVGRLTRRNKQGTR